MTRSTAPSLLRVLFGGALALTLALPGVSFGQSEAEQERLIRLREDGLKAAARGKIAEAQEKFKEALDLDPGHADTWFHYGQTYQRTGKLDDAIKYYTKAISLLSGHHKAYHNRGVAYWYQGKLELALADVDEAVRLNTKYAEAWNTRASLLASMGKCEDAIGDATQAIELVERFNDKRKKPLYYVAAYHTRAIAALRIGKLDQAKKDLTLACEKAPEQAPYKLRLGVALFRLGEQEAAIKAYDEALGVTKDSSFPSGRPPRPLSDYLRARCIAGRGQSKFLKGDAEGALADLVEAEKLTPEHAYTPLWIHGLGGTPASLERLSTHEFEKDDDKWIQQILLLYRGKKTEAELLELAKTPEKEEEQQQRLLQVHCYLALLAERKGDAAAAKAHYEKGVALGVLGYTEHWWSKLRLAQLAK